jgi:hypothetical protein
MDTLSANPGLDHCWPNLAWTRCIHPSRAAVRAEDSGKSPGATICSALLLHCFDSALLADAASKTLAARMARIILDFMLHASRCKLLNAI